MTERQFWVGFNKVAGVGPVRVRQLLEHFGTLSSAWVADAAELAQAGLDQRSVKNLLVARQHFDLNAEMARLDKLGIAVITWEDDIYPRLLGQLREIDEAPPILYMRGTLQDADEWSLAIVGTRSISAYGRQVTHRLATELAANGLTIISGLARGVDAEAHTATLDAGGRTIAVLGCGLDTIYPPEHRQLAARIIHNGALISPFPIGTLPEGKNFAPRNRVLSGMARGVLVTEASDKSGAMLTAGYAGSGTPSLCCAGEYHGAGKHWHKPARPGWRSSVLSAEDILEY
jgi:DNA processing protein